MQSQTLNDCPCGSNNTFTNCCAQYIEKEKPAPTAEKLMRSRYTAYTLNNSEYLLKTWHNTTRPTTLNLTLEPAVEWLRLKVCHTEAGEIDSATGSVEFIASYRAGGKTEVIHEVSRFVNEEGHWYYLNGKLSQPSQNGPCPCSNGKKFKRCCGK